MNRILLRRTVVAGALILLGCFSTQAQSASPTLYGLTFFGNQLISVEPTNGAGTLVGPLNATVSGYGIAARYGRLYTFNPNTDQIEEINPTTGALGNSINIGVTNLVGEGDLAFRSDGTGFLVSALHTNGTVADDFYTFDVISGTSHRVGTSSGPIDALAFDNNNTLYALEQDGTNLYTINQNDGTMIVVGPLGVAMSSPFAAMTFGPDGTLYAAINDQLYTINKNTGAASMLSTNVLDIGFSSVSGLAFAVPPSSGQLTLTPEAGKLVLYWSGSDFTLESATNVAGPYTTADFQANPSRISPTNSQMYFRLEQ
jgi:outer membrane protein assembly factor BamB